MCFSFVPIHAKKKKMSMLVHEMCREISAQIGKFVQSVGKLDEDDVGTTSSAPITTGGDNQ